MLLEVHERMQLIQLLPAEGGFEALKTIRIARETLSINAEEKKILGFEQTQNPDGTVNYTWQGKNASKVVKDVPIDEYMTNLFRKKLVEIEDEGKLTENTMSIFEKFVVMYK